MGSHQATEQLIGYLYQVKYALQLLLEQDDPSYQISIEKFDDVAFEKNGTPKELIQVKHHIGKIGSLSDASVDLWRTLKVWMDAVKEDYSLIDETYFLLITTANAPKESAAYWLRESNHRNVEKAYDLLKKVAEGQGNNANKSSYNLFKKMDKEKMLSLLNKVKVLDRSVNIIDVDKKIKRQLRFSCTNKNENNIFERLVGWWFNSSINALTSENPVFINQKQIRELIVRFNQEYHNDNLPIDDDILNLVDIDESKLPVKKRIFLEQLRLLGFSDSILMLALSDYFRASQQRSRWVRNDLLCINELETYERKLIEEWNRSFVWMCELIKDEDIDDEKEIIKRGKYLYKEIMDKEIRIRHFCGEPFVMKGSYQILSNNLKVGWHKDFYNRLRCLLSKEEL